MHETPDPQLLVLFPHLTRLLASPSELGWDALVVNDMVVVKDMVVEQDAPGF